jgi:chromosome segregation ATPase
VALLEDELSLAKTQLSNATDELRLLRGTDLKLTTTEARLERQREQWEAEVSSMRQRIQMLENENAENNTTGVEWKHRAERAEQESALALKDRDRGREELKAMRDRLTTVEGLCEILRFNCNNSNVLRFLFSSAYC